MYTYFNGLIVWYETEPGIWAHPLIDTAEMLVLMSMYCNHGHCIRVFPTCKYSIHSNHTVTTS